MSEDVQVPDRYTPVSSRVQAQMDRLRNLHRSTDIEGLSTHEQAQVPTVTSETGAVRPASSSTPMFLRSVAIALVREEIAAHSEGREPNSTRALEAAGCPVEMWIDIANNPEFTTILRQAEYALIVLPKEPRATLAFSNDAAMGKPGAKKYLDSWRDEMHPRTAELLKAYNEGERGRQMFVRKIEEYLLEMEELRDSFATSKAHDSDIRGEVAQKMADIRALEKDAAINHKALYGGET